MTDAVRTVARTYFEDAAPAHDWNHVRRVESLADRLATNRDDVSAAVLEYAVLLHDIGREREDAGEIEDHAEWGAREARSILDSEGVAQGVIDAVRHCIRAHRFSNDIEPETPEARILCDADNLDALGAVGIARVFSHGGATGFPMHDPELPVEADDSVAGRTSINHVEKKILSLRDRMYTDAGREIADQRHAVCRRFLDRFEREVAGDA